MEKKIKVAFIYKKNYPLINGQFWSTIHYNFFMKALKRNSRIDVTYFPCDEQFDITKYGDLFDVILLLINDSESTPNIIGIDKIRIPVISGVGDVQENIPRDLFHKKWKINAYFSHIQKNIFYKYYPKDFLFKEIFYGLEPDLHTNIVPFEQRIKNKILCSGAIGNSKFFSRILNSIRNPKENALVHYKLRTLCTKLSFVDYTYSLQHEYVRDKYTLLLQKYGASIAASTFQHVSKYIEMPASGCLTFMEINKMNKLEILGFKNYESAIFINEDNYKEKFQEYLDDSDNPKWQMIANNGREHALTNFNNDKAVNDLVNLMEELIINNIF